MLLFVGLGNPGIEYANNRHNLGFMAIDRVVEKYNFTGYQSKFLGQFSSGKINSQRIGALKPSTFVNGSGKSVLSAINFFKLKTEQVVVFHDDLDLKASDIRIKQGGGHGGHNGLRSISESIGSDYRRGRMGIGRPPAKDQVVDYVLKNFSTDEQVWVKKVMDIIQSEIAIVVENNSGAFKKVEIKY